MRKAVRWRERLKARVTEARVPHAHSYEDNVKWKKTILLPTQETPLHEVIETSWERLHLVRCVR